MLNLVTFNISDRSLLENSYNSLINKEQIEIVTDNKEKELVFKQTIDNIKTPNNANFSFQNLFKVIVGNGNFYIAQCLLDFGYPIGTKGSQTFQQKYFFQLVGIANLIVDVGITHLRPETKLDKFISRFINDDIDFEGAEKFNDKYLLVSNKQTEVLKYFNKTFLESLAKHNDILLTTNGRQMYISFDAELTVNQSRELQDIFSNFEYLERQR